MAPGVARTRLENLHFTNWLNWNCKHLVWVVHILTSLKDTKRIIEALQIEDLPAVATPATGVLGKDPDGDPPNCTFNYASVIGMLWCLCGHPRRSSSHWVTVGIVVVCCVIHMFRKSTLMSILPMVHEGVR